jgi:hypothetical protein
VVEHHVEPHFEAAFVGAGNEVGERCSRVVAGGEGPVDGTPHAGHVAPVVVVGGRRGRDVVVVVVGLLEREELIGREINDVLAGAARDQVIDLRPADDREPSRP